MSLENIQQIDSASIISLVANTIIVSGSITSSACLGNLYGTSSWAVASIFNIFSSTSSYSMTSSKWIDGPIIKSGIVSGSFFTGNPKTFLVTFDEPFPNLLYSISVTGEIVRSWTIQNKSTNGFRINANNNSSFTSFVYWTAISRGEY